MQFTFDPETHALCATPEDPMEVMAAKYFAIKFAANPTAMLIINSEIVKKPVVVE